MADARQPRDAATRNRFAFMALMAGIASCVPWLVVFLAPIAWGFAALAYVEAARHPARRAQIKLAHVGLGLSVASAVLQLALGVLAAGIGYLFEAVRG